MRLTIKYIILSYQDIPRNIYLGHDQSNMQNNQLTHSICYNMHIPKEFKTRSASEQTLEQLCPLCYCTCLADGWQPHVTIRSCKIVHLTTEQSLIEMDITLFIHQVTHQFFLAK